MGENLFEVKNITKVFRAKKAAGKKGGQFVHAVNDVSFQIKEKETFALVGESGCGKSTTGRVALRLIEPSSGDILYQGKSLLSLNSRELRKMRREMQMVFQDPYSSLNPRKSILSIVAEPLLIHKMAKSKAEAEEEARKLLLRVGIREDQMNRYPHEFSGGQRQRIGIARALAVNPSFIVCDEPVSALDVSIQAQVINMFEDLQKKLGVAYLFIAHDLLVVHHISDRIAVMYLGKIVEIADADELNENPLHPYTESLLSAIPMPDPNMAKERKRIILEGDVPSPMNLPSGCAFRTRCRYATEQCAKECPSLTDRGNGHMVSCFNR